MEAAMEYDFEAAYKRMEKRRSLVRELKKNDGTFQEIGLPEPQIEAEKKQIKTQKTRALNA